MKNVRVINDYRIIYHKVRDPKVDWDYEESEQINNIKGIEISDSFSDFPIPYDLVKGNIYYLLYAIYSTGDSFTSASGQIEYIDLYESETLANAAMKMIENDYKEYKKTESDYSCEYVNNQGQLVKMSCPWKGYFEGLTTAEVVEVMLQEEDD